jgi:predicted nucleotidyltransferase component of viral defense system
MIKTARQLKDKIRNLAKEKSADAQFLMRSFMMERFLERVVQSDYHANFILKGGVLLASLVGFDFRSTMDLDATIEGSPLRLPEVENMIQEIIAIPLGDGVSFQIHKMDYIMEDADYPGIRVGLQAFFDGTETPLKVDVTSGDVITPGAVSYSYRLMFEDRTIQILSYNLETILAEKLETIVRRHITNTRMRDFYDIYTLKKYYGEEISQAVLKTAVKVTAHRRGSREQLKLVKTALSEIEASEEMQKLWRSYQSYYHYVSNIEWHEVMEAIRAIVHINGWEI